jgi:hypothetical protein
MEIRNLIPVGMEPDAGDDLSLEKRSPRREIFSKK